MEEKLLRAGNKLRKTRIRLGLKLRGVASASREIAEKEGYDGYGFCHATLARIERGHETPSNLPKQQAANGRNITGLFDPASDGDGLAGSFPHNGVNSALMSLYRAVETWDALSTQLLLEPVAPHLLCGYIGLLDRTMYPMLCPGSVVLIDTRRRNVESRVGCFCSWFEKQGDCLIVFPHPASRCPTRSFRFPEDAKVVGRVVAMAGPLPAAKPAARNCLLDPALALRYE